MKMADKNTPICILGAGPSGLFIAEKLVEKGFQNITVIEKRRVPGGKANTWTDPNGLKYNMGPIVTFAESNMTPYFEKFDVPTYHPSKEQYLFNLPTGASVDFDTIPNRFKPVKENSAAIAAYTKYCEIHSVYKKYLIPGFTRGIPDELNTNFHDFLVSHDLQVLLPAVWFGLTNFGYASLKELPTIYALAYLQPIIFRTYLGIEPFMLTDFTLLMTRLAASLEEKVTFHYGAKVTVIERRDTDPTVIKFLKEGQEFELKCEKLVCAFPQLLPRLEAFDLDDLETSVFSNVKIVHYKCAIVHLPHASKSAGPHWNMLQEWDSVLGRLGLLLHNLLSFVGLDIPLLRYGPGL